MSDLFCAATVLFARHGDAEYVEDWFSDEGGTLTTRGREQARALADAVAGRRIARVWSSDASRAVQTAEITADRLHVPVAVRKALREIRIGDLLGEPFDARRLRAVTDRWADGDLDVRFPGGESGQDVVARYRRQLGDIADEHRGETVLVIGHESAACAALPALVTDLHPPHSPRLRHLDHGELVELMIDADGCRLVSWA